MSKRNVPRSCPACFVFIFIYRSQDPSIQRALKVKNGAYRLAVLINRIAVISRCMACEGSKNFSNVRIVRSFYFVGVRVMVFPNAPSRVIRDLGVILFHTLLRNQCIPIKCRNFMDLLRCLVGITNALGRYCECFIFRPINSRYECVWVRQTINVCLGPTRTIVAHCYFNRRVTSVNRLRRWDISRYEEAYIKEGAQVIIPNGIYRVVRRPEWRTVNVIKPFMVSKTKVPARRYPPCVEQRLSTMTCDNYVLEGYVLVGSQFYHSIRTSNLER